LNQVQTSGLPFFICKKGDDMEIKLNWSDKKGLERYANKLLKSHPELNSEYPIKKRKRETYIVNFKAIEDEGGAGLQSNLCLNAFERQVYSSLCIAPAIENLTTVYVLKWAVLGLA